MRKAPFYATQPVLSGGPSERKGLKTRRVRHGSENES